MITRAIIVDTDLAHGKVQVRIPIFDGIGNSGIYPYSTDNLSWACICYIPGINVEYRIGDVVYIGFENNDIGMPVVLGFLKLNGIDIESRVYGEFRELEIEDKFVAPTDTTIGITPYEDIFNIIDENATGSGDDTGIDTDEPVEPEQPDEPDEPDEGETEEPDTGETEEPDTGEDGDGEEEEEPTPTQLASPVISATGSTISWAAIENADSYDILIDESVVATITETSYTINIEEVGSHTVTVVAKSNNELYLDSEPSNFLTFVVEEEEEEPSEEATQLSSPEISISDNVISWGSVENASGYDVLVNDRTKATVTDTSYTLVIGAAGTYSITVVAQGDDTNYLDSEPSNTVSYTVTEGEAVWHDATDEDGNFVEITSDQIPDDTPYAIELTNSTAQRMSDVFDCDKNENRSTFNCYRWAVDYYGEIQDGTTPSSMAPGDLCGVSVDASEGVRANANAVIQDLMSSYLNKKNIKWATGIPDTDDLADGEHLIAFRLGYRNTGSIYDIHFMKYTDGDGSYNGWTHKPGSSLVLQLHEDILPWDAIDVNGVSMWVSESASSDSVEDGDDFVLIGGAEGGTSSGASDMSVLATWAYASQIVYVRYTDE